MAKKDCNLLQGISEITEVWRISEKQFYMFISIGFPARKIQGRWYAHSVNIDDWFKQLLRNGKPIELH